MSIFRRRLMMGQGESEPKPYDKKIEYLEGTGNQYINTGIVPDIRTGVYVKVRQSNTSDTYLLGLRQTTGNTRWCVGSGNSGYYYGYGNYQSINRLLGNPAEIMLDFMDSGKFAKADGSYEVNLPSSMGFTPTIGIRLFGSAGVTASYSKWAGKIYFAKFSQGNEILMDLIPVRIGNVGYMYDKVSKQLFGNDGTGDFILGGDI